MKIIVNNTCLLCDKKFDWHEPILCKLPENVCFCMECSEKFEDKNEYKWINTWFVTEFENWIELYYWE